MNNVNAKLHPNPTCLFCLAAEYSSFLSSIMPSPFLFCEAKSTIEPVNYVLELNPCKESIERIARLYNQNIIWFNCVNLFCDVEY